MYSNQSKGLAGLANGMSPQIGQAEEFYSKKVAEEGADPNDMTAFLSKIYKVTQDPNLIGAIVNRHMAKQLAASMAPPGAQPSPPTVTDKIKLDLMNLKKAKEQKNQQAQADLQSALTGQAQPQPQAQPPQQGAMQQGIGGMDAGSMEAPQAMNTGGIVAFATGGAPHLAAEAEEAAYLNSPDIEERIAQAEQAADRGDVKAKSWLTRTRALINSGQYGKSIGSAANVSPTLLKWATTGAKLARKVATPLAVAGAAGDIYKEVTDPNATAGEKALRVARSTGRLAAQGLGAEAGLGLGALTGPAAPIAAPLLSMAGGWGAGKLYDLLGSEEEDAKTSPAAPTVEDIQKDRMIEEATKLDTKSGSTGTGGTPFGMSYKPISTKGIDEAYKMKADELARRQQEIKDRPNKPRTLGSIPEEYAYQQGMIKRAREAFEGARDRSSNEFAADLISSGGRGINLVAATGDALKASVQRSNQYHKDYLEAMDKADAKYVEFKKADAKAKETDDKNDYDTARAKEADWHQAAMDVATAKDAAEKAKAEIEDKNVNNQVAIENAKSSRISANATAAYRSSSTSGAALDVKTKNYIMTNYTKLLPSLQMDPKYIKATPTQRKQMEDNLYNSIAEKFGATGSSGMSSSGWELVPQQVNNGYV